MASNLFNLIALLCSSKILISKTCHKLFLPKKATNSCTTQLEIQKYPFVALKEEQQQLGPNQTLMFHVEGTLLKSSSMFSYFMLVAFEGGGPFRALVLLLLYPFIGIVSEEIALKIMVFVCFVGVNAESFRIIGRSVLPKFFLEDVGNEGFDMVMGCGRKIGISNFPRVMIEGFLKYYLGIEEVFGRELKEFCGYFVGFMESKKINNNNNNKSFLKEPKMENDDIIGFACQNKSSIDHHLFSHCKAIYVVSEGEKRNWQVLPRKKYPKPLIFHDGRLALKPTPLSIIAMFMWIPFGFILCIIRAIIGILFPYKLSIPILHLIGMKGILSKPKSFTSQPNKKEGMLYVCNHKTLFDPIYVSIVMMKPLTAVTYSLSKVSEFFAPIKTVRLTRNREDDLRRIKQLLSKGDVAICPEGTTCREPYLLRFSPLFAEASSRIVPMAINMEVSMFYATTAGGFKCLDPLYLLMNPYVTCNFKILDMLEEKLTCQFGGKSKFEVANYVQAQIGKALQFECTSLTRKDKYMFLAGNEGMI